MRYNAKLCDISFGSTRLSKCPLADVQPKIHKLRFLRNKFDFWNVHGIMNTSDLLLRRASLTSQETRSIHDSMDRPKIEFIAYIYILLLLSELYKLFII